MNTRAAMSWTAVVLTSLGFHAAVFAAFSGPRAAIPRAAKPPSFIELSALPSPVGEAPVAEAGPARPVSRRTIAKRPAPRPAAPPADAPATAEAPADFTGTTLTSAGVGAGWTSATGSGERMAGPIGRPGAKVTGDSAGDAAGAPVVGAGDLSRLPVAPALDDALERNYPASARRAGRKGEAMVRARIMPDGRVRELRVVSESSAGFGPACVATLAQSRWTAPVNRDGNAVSTYIHYTCRFEVR